MKQKKGNQVSQNPKEVLKKIGSKMAKIRKEQGFKNSDAFAYDKGVNRSQYGKYEAGSQNMRFASLLKTINKLGLTFEEFFGNGLDTHK